jgi:hypothetical protein
MKTLEALKKDLLERPPFNNNSYRSKDIRESLDAAIAERDALRSKLDNAGSDRTDEGGSVK